MLIVLKSPFHFLLNEKINFNAFFIVKILFTKNRLKIPILGIILKEKVIFEVEKYFFSTQNVIDSDRYWWDLSKTVFGISKFPLDRKICTKNVGKYGENSLHGNPYNSQSIIDTYLKF